MYCKLQTKQERILKMGFQTYTCCICGKTGLTKRNTYFIEGKGRACREHEQAKQANDVREEKRNITQHKDFSRYYKLMKIMNDMKNRPIYQMKHKDNRPEINLFLNFIEFSKYHAKYNVDGSMSAIFDSDEYINSFHPNFDAALDRIKELTELDHVIVESLAILDDEMNKALIESNSQTDESLNRLYGECVCEAMAFFQFITGIKNDEHRENEFIKFYKIFVERAIIKIAVYENKFSKTAIPDMETFIEMIKVLVANIEKKKFVQCVDKSWTDAVITIANLYAKLRNHAENIK